MICDSDSLFRFPLRDLRASAFRSLFSDPFATFAFRDRRRRPPVASNRGSCDNPRTSATSSDPSPDRNPLPGKPASPRARSTARAALFAALPVLLASGAGWAQPGEEPETPAVSVPRIAGEWTHFFDPNLARDDHKGEWYCNDHTLVRDTDGRWHAYGIIWHRPPKPWENEKQFFHATSPTLVGGEMWEDHGYAMRNIPGKEAVIWAPHARRIDGCLWMFYNAGNMREDAGDWPSWGTMHIARSDESDGFAWERDELNPIFSDPGHARDSFVAEFDGTWHWYYTRTVNEVDQRSAVGVRTSPDLEHWSGARLVWTHAPGGHWGGNAESPQVIHRDGLYYLFVTLAMEGYDKTHVYWSRDPLHFPREQFVTRLDVHAPEIIRDTDGAWYITNCGWDKQGLYIAPLEWSP